MKITKTQLRRIIKEELLSEIGPDWQNQPAKDFFDGGGKWKKRYASQAISKMSGFTWNAKDPGPTKYSIWAHAPEERVNRFLSDHSDSLDALVEKYNSEGPYKGRVRLAWSPKRGKVDEHGEEALVLTFYVEQ